MTNPFFKNTGPYNISYLLKNIEDGQTVMGYPAVPLKDFLKNSLK